MRVLLGIAIWLSLAASASAAQFVFAFDGTVISVTAHAETDGRSVEIGAPITGGYSYDINPNNSEQTINPLFWFATGTLVREIENLYVYPNGLVISQFMFWPDSRPDLSYVEFMSLDAAGRFDFRYTGHYGFLEFVAQLDVRDVSPVPAPGGIALLAGGILAAIAFRRRAGNLPWPRALQPAGSRRTKERAT